MAQTNIAKRIKLGELANLVEAQLIGDASLEITGIAPLQHASDGMLSFLSNPRYVKYLADTKATAVIINVEFKHLCNTNALIVTNPYAVYAKIVSLFAHRAEHIPGIHKTAAIGEHCQIHASAFIGPNCVIGKNVVIDEHVHISAGSVIGDNCHIASNSWLHANVTLYHQVEIGQRCIIHSGVVIGSDGFGIAQDNGVWKKIEQIGGVVIGNDVEIGANTTIDRGALDDTVIEDGVKLDNQIQVAHNVRIGAHTVIAGCTGISGSTQIGSHCMIGGACCIGGHITITDNVVLTATTGVNRSITKPGVYSGSGGAQDNAEWRKNNARFKQLDRLARKVLNLEKLMKETS